jgi:predicted amidohydrolase
LITPSIALSIRLRYRRNIYFDNSQAGTHAPGRESYGHSLIIGPFGEILASIDTSSETDDKAGSFVTAEIDLPSLQQIRKEIPLWEQRRTDLYPEL